MILFKFDGVLHPDGTQYVPPRAWRDLFNAIENAQKFIYITGWSVYTNIHLLRGTDDPDGVSHVGELLKNKANNKNSSSAAQENGQQEKDRGPSTENRFIPPKHTLL